MEEQQNKKLVVGFFSFTCCEGCTILISELLNDNFDTWRKLVEFRHFKTLKSKNELRDLDVAFVEGAISSPDQEEELKKIRANCKKLVAYGSCACTGLPSASRNQIPEDKYSQKMGWYFNNPNFRYNKIVKKIDDIVTVDAKVPGCPMNAQLFVQAVEAMLKEFKVI